MLKKVRQRASKLGGASGAPATSFKFQYTVVVHSVEFVVADKKWYVACPVSQFKLRHRKPEHLLLEWKRNARVATTKQVKFDLKPTEKQVVQWEDELDMLATLTKDGGGPDYDRKEYKFNFEDVMSAPSCLRSFLSLNICIHRCATRKAAKSWLTGASILLPTQT